ncbi:hypothetical protein F3Y22_tig00110597pilonHSYRG00879 [Hibiscus syriacus]|uniref:MADS-box domain-containing protein n=1 Tax=Hibiscus syriacus TaxID=106335 RepID=A0A6A3A3E1_HIBSY|nr:hypothetical protein F3Y22_tig00110597pilonHSYRG00879 [Hibiscus syriacus]
MEKKTLGRQRDEMKKMTNETHLLVSFSKLKAGLLKKASEISTLRGAELAIVIFSPSQKAFSFGNPTVDTVIDRYLNRNPPDTSGTSLLVDALQINVLTSEFQQPKIEQLDTSQLLELKSALERLKKNVEEQKGVAFDVNMIDGRYVVPNMIVPTPGYSLNPFEGYNANIAEEYNIDPVNPTDDDDADPVEEYIIDPLEVNNVGSAQEYNDNPPEGRNIYPVEGYNPNS